MASHHGTRVDTAVMDQRKDAAQSGIKRVAENLDQLPYQRKQTFRRRLYSDLDDEVRDFVARNLSGEVLRVAFGQIVGKESRRPVILPLATEAILAGNDHGFERSLSHESFEELYREIESQHRTWQTASAASRKWVELSFTEKSGRISPPAQDSLIFYSPNGNWHYQLQSGCSTEEGEECQEFSYLFRKEAAPGTVWWKVSLFRSETSLQGELELNTGPLREQHKRMCAGKKHGFYLIVGAILRNARALVRVLNRSKQGEHRLCYYPGICEPSDRVREHYAQKASQRRSWPTAPSQSDNIRRHNNLIKVLLLEQYVDTLPAPIRVLDLGCGNGQDIQKFSRAFRGSKLESYVGVDFASAATAEALRRHDALVRKSAGNSIGEYMASFYTADVRDTKIFDKLMESGHSEFDVITMQFMLQYVAESERAVHILFSQLRRLLRPGGRIIGCIPSCDILADLYKQNPNEPVNPLYTVKFDEVMVARMQSAGEDMDALFSDKWGVPYTFSLIDAVDGQQEYVVPWESFEQLIENLGFRVMLDASFPELLSEYCGTSTFFASVFSSQKNHADLTTEEEEVFSLYSGFVPQRMEDTSDASAPL